MTIDDQELRAIAFLALRVRRATPNAGTWDELGLMTNLRKIQNRNLHMTIEHVLRHAADPKAKNPGVILGSFTPEAPKLGHNPYPPKKQDECRTHAGQYAANCGGCRADALAEADDPEAEFALPEADSPAEAVRRAAGFQPKTPEVAS